MDVWMCVQMLVLYAHSGPCDRSGMIVYNGQRKSTGADFMSLGLVGGRLEFRSASSSSSVSAFCHVQKAVFKCGYFLPRAV